MRRILVEQARRRRADKHGGGRLRVALPADLPPGSHSNDLAALAEAGATRAASVPTAAAQYSPSSPRVATPARAG